MIHRTTIRVLAAAGLALSLAACKDFQAIDPSFQNVTASDTVYALNGGPPNAPNTLKFFDGLVEHADQGFGFDIAFDLDPSGNIVLIPARALATTFTTPYSVAIQQVNGPFEAVIRAPESGYRPDTATVVSVGQTVVFESRDNGGVCAFSLKGQAYYSKLVVTEVDLANRRMVFTLTVNRNCGFRSFEPGFPSD
jgi:hypothetical protein